MMGPHKKDFIVAGLMGVAVYLVLVFYFLPKDMKTQERSDLSVFDVVPTTPSGAPGGV